MINATSSNASGDMTAPPLVIFPARVSVSS